MVGFSRRWAALFVRLPPVLSVWYTRGCLCCARLGRAYRDSRTAALRAMAN